MSFAGGNPNALAGAASGLRAATTDVGGIARDVSAAASRASGGVGAPALSGAVDRFAAAWGGELIACGCAAGTLAQIATTNADQLTAATGGGRAR